MFPQITFRYGTALLASLLLLTACTNNNAVEPVPAPSSEDAAFTFSVDPNNPNQISFSAMTEVDAWYTHWAFGDNTAAEGMTATKTYPLSGEYEVRFKVFTEGGTAESTQMVSITTDLVGPNLIQNGAMDGDEFWMDFPISPGVEVTFAQGVASWAGGGNGHAGIYQAIEVEANQTYQVDMNVKGGGLTDSWFEVYVGTTEPTPGVDYTNGGIRLGLNTWEGCGSDPINGPFTIYSCTGDDGTFQFPTNRTVYLVIRGGGADYGDEGLTIDNVSVRPL
jgi:hypothetical protein